MSRTVSGCLTCSTAPQAIPLGYSHKGNSTRGNNIWVVQGKQGTRVQRREGEGSHSPSGNLRKEAPPSGCRNPLLRSVRNGKMPFGPPNCSKVTGLRVY